MRSRSAKSSSAGHLGTKGEDADFIAYHLPGRTPILDLPREYDDGGLVDVNHVPGDVLASHLALTAQEVKAVIDARAQLGEFSSADELPAYAEFAPAKVDEVRDLMWFG